MSITSFSSPILYDQVAQELNTALASKFDDQYPVCWTRTENDETVPEVYQNDGTKVNLRVMPDTFRSMSFFTVEGELSELDELDFACPMALTFWVNLQKYAKSKQYDYTSELIRDVVNIIRNYGGYDFSVNINDPFEGFSMLDKERNENTMRPMSAAKISFTKNARICDT